MMRTIFLFLCFVAVVLTAQFVSGYSASCEDIWVDTEDVFVQGNDVEYFYFPVYNDAELDFQVFEARAWRRTGDFEITLVDYPNDVEELDEGEFTIKIETDYVDEESVGEAYAKLRGQFEDGEYCTFSDIGEFAFEVTVEEDGEEEPECGDISLYVDDVSIGEDSTKTVTFRIENYSDMDFDLYEIDVDESSSYFDAELYSAPSWVDSGEEEDFRIRIESNRVSSDRQGSITVQARGRFEDGTYCSSDSIEEIFTVFVDNVGNGFEPEPEPGQACENLWLDAGIVRVEKGSTKHTTIFVENTASEDFIVEYISIFDLSRNISAEENGYEKRIPSFGSGFINVEVRANDFAEAGTEDAFVEIKGHFQSGESCSGYGDVLAFQVVVEEKQPAAPEEAYFVQPECTKFSLIAPERVSIGNSGSVRITIDNRTMDRATIRLYGPGLTLEPQLISVPRTSTISESIAVSSRLPESTLVYEIDALGCDSTKETKVFMVGTQIEEEQPGEDEKEAQPLPMAIEALSAGFFVLGQASIVIGIIVLVVLVAYLVLKR